MKHKKIKIIISSLIILLPIVFGLLMWNKLPDTIITHWGVNNEPNGWQSKIAVVLQPLVFLALHFVLVFTVKLDKRNKFQNPVVMDLIYWLIPALSIFTCFVIYATALGFEISVGFFAQIFIGILFLVLGLIMPKIKQNGFIGIRVKWTLESEENWNATHIFGGKIWAVCGFVMILGAFLPDEISFILLTVMILISVIVPTVYSYKLSKKNSNGK